MTLNRYHRQMLLPGVGEEGQARLSQGHALLVGCGALGCTIADLLVRAGVGMVTIVDRDVVELTNLQRQSLFDEGDVAEGLPKAAAAQRRLERVNSDVCVRAIVADFTAENAERIAAGGEGSMQRDCDVDPGGALSRQTAAQVIIDGTDNFETRYLMNDVAVKHGIPYVYGGAVGTRGMQLTIRATGRGEGGLSEGGGPRLPCLRCIFEEMPAPGTSATCDTAGIFAPVAAIVAACEAADALKILMGREGAVGGTLLEFDLWGNERRRLDVSGMARPDCLCCAPRPHGGRFEYLDAGVGAGGTTTLCGRGSVQVMPAGQGRGLAGEGAPRLDLGELARRLGPHGSFRANRFLMRGEFVGERGERGEAMSLTVFADGRAIVHGTTDSSRARAIYARYVGS